MKFFWKYKIDHILFWLATILFHSFIINYILKKAGTGYFVIDLITRNGLLMLACYFNVYFLFSKYFRQKKYLLYAAGILLSIAFYTAIKNAEDSWMYGDVLHDIKRSGYFYNSYYNFSTSLFYICFTLALYLSKQWFAQQQLLQKIQMEKLQAELQYLKSQINPHFLFNSLNSIHFLIDKNNLEARESLQQFSGILRYQLYECNADRIPVEKEIANLQNYILLQRLRKNENCSIELICSNEVKNFSIAPLLLMPLTENAFKHVSDFEDKENSIKISLHNTNNTFLFEAYNTKDSSVKTETSKSGIGLANVRRRLELLYNGKHTFTIHDDGNSFTAQLQIQLL